MTLGQSISTCLRKYAVFSGRAPRSEYWWWQLFCALILTASLIIGFATVLSFEIDDAAGIVATVYAMPMLLYFALWLPSLAVTVRRLHDSGHSGWWAILPGFCGFIGAIFILIFTLAPSSHK